MWAAADASQKSRILGPDISPIPCCIDYDARLVMGNVREKTLEEIWHGEKFRQIRSEHLAGKYLDVCAQCHEWVGGPPNRAYPLGKPFFDKLRGLRDRL